MKLTVAFDCDDTLGKWQTDGRFVPDHNIIDLLMWFLRNGHKVIVWSGAGIEFAEKCVHDFNLAYPGNVPKVVEKGSVAVDIAVDDMGGFDSTAQHYVQQELKNAKVTIVV